MRFFTLFLAMALALFAQRSPVDRPSELLWPNGAPGAVGTEDLDKPAITPWLPAKPNGQAVVVFPGGGYGGLANDHEGKQIAAWLNSQGISAFVVKYRLGPRYHHPAPLQDAQESIRLVRSRAAQYSIDPKRIGVWGFSAGGHLASTTATQFTSPENRPDFAILAYPVITLSDEPFVHKGSRRNLLGESPDPKLVELLSTDKQVKRDTPPIFLFHTNEDTGVPPENAVYFYLACRKAGVPVEMHIYEKGPHGVGLGATEFTLATWPARLADWLQRR